MPKVEQLLSLQAQDEDNLRNYVEQYRLIQGKKNMY